MKGSKAARKAIDEKAAWAVHGTSRTFFSDGGDTAGVQREVHSQDSFTKKLVFRTGEEPAGKLTKSIGVIVIIFMIGIGLFMLLPPLISNDGFTAEDVLMIFIGMLCCVFGPIIGITIWKMKPMYIEGGDIYYFNSMWGIVVGDYLKKYPIDEAETVYSWKGETPFPNKNRIHKWKYLLKYGRYSYAKVVDVHFPEQDRAKIEKHIDSFLNSSMFRPVSTKPNIAGLLFEDQYLKGEYQEYRNWKNLEPKTHDDGK